MFFVKYEELCKKNKKTTTGVASELGVAKSTVAYWRSNHNVIPKQEILTKIAEYFSVSTDYLLGIERPDNGTTVTDEDIKFALFDGDKEITDEMYNEVKEFAKYVKSKYKKE